MPFHCPFTDFRCLSLLCHCLFTVFHCSVIAFSQSFTAFHCLAEGVEAEAGRAAAAIADAVPLLANPLHLCIETPPAKVTAGLQQNESVGGHCRRTGWPAVSAVRDRTRSRPPVWCHSEGGNAFWTVVTQGNDSGNEAFLRTTIWRAGVVEKRAVCVQTPPDAVLATCALPRNSKSAYQLIPNTLVC